MKIIYWTKNGRAMIEGASIDKEFAKSIRFVEECGATITIKRDDIVSIEEDDPEDKVSAAIDAMNDSYVPFIKKALDRQDRCGTVTVTVNSTELSILRALVTDRLDELRKEWYDATHRNDDTSVADLAYELSLTERSERQLQKLLTKLTKKEETSNE